MINKNILSKTLIIIGIFFVLIIIFAIINSMFAKCKENHILDSTNNLCYYNSNICEVNEDTQLINDKNVCVYKPIGLLNSTLVIGIIIFLIGLFLVVLILMFIFLNKGQMFTKLKKRTSEDKIIDAFCLWYARHTGITTFNTVYDNAAFHIQPRRHTVDKGEEEFVMFNVLVLQGNQPGLLTVEASLSKGEDFILGGGANFDLINYSSYKRPKGYALYTPQDPFERMLKRYEEINPEKALEKHQEMLEKQLNAPKNIVQESVPQEEAQQPKLMKPAYKQRKYRSRYPRR